MDGFRSGRGAVLGVEETLKTGEAKNGNLTFELLTIGYLDTNPNRTQYLPKPLANVKRILREKVSFNLKSTFVQQQILRFYGHAKG